MVFDGLNGKNREMREQVENQRLATIMDREVWPKLTPSERYMIYRTGGFFIGGAVEHVIDIVRTNPSIRRRISDSRLNINSRKLAFKLIDGWYAHERQEFELAKRNERVVTRKNKPAYFDQMFKKKISLKFRKRF